MVNDAVLFASAANSTGLGIRADLIAATVAIVGRRADLIVGTRGAYFLLDGGDSELEWGATLDIACWVGALAVQGIALAVFTALRVRIAHKTAPPHVRAHRFGCYSFWNIGWAFTTWR